jgi:signal transduction histidine kinase
MTGMDPIAEGQGGAGPWVRFDDRLRTVLAQPMDTPEARAIAWRQAADLIAQQCAGAEESPIDAAYALLRAFRGEVPAALRAEVARSLAGQPLPADLIAILADQDPALIPAEDTSTPGGEAGHETRVGSFRFETGADGAILWVAEAPRGPLIGLPLTVPADPFDRAAGGIASGAVRRRAPFRDVRLSVAGVGPAAGEWRVSAVPFHDPVDNRFIGYRGTARRFGPQDGARLGGIAGGLPSDPLRQTVHELRTPLNAIVGFAEMIERQMLGPAARRYRGHAAYIAGEGRRLLSAVDDLDVYARIETDRLGLLARPVDVARLLARLRPGYERMAAARGVTLDVAVTGDPLPARADPAAAERMFARLLSATVGLAQRDEKIAVRLNTERGGRGDLVALRVTRPHVLTGRDERILLDPGFGSDGDWPDAPALSTGFTLRLVRELAAVSGGGLEIAGDAFTLRLPRAAQHAAEKLVGPEPI